MVRLYHKVWREKSCVLGQVQVKRDPERFDVVVPQVRRIFCATLFSAMLVQLVA